MSTYKIPAINRGVYKQKVAVVSDPLLVYCLSSSIAFQMQTLCHKRYKLLVIP